MEKSGEMGKKELGFAVFCVENIAEYLGISGADAYVLLTDGGNILDNYIIQYYDTLHTQGREYITNDIIECMKKEGVLS